ncbi:MAG: 4-(cytidine 5'-diphospho)-2-C-methyl-D-erythritol kinase [Peptococcaceae bacterium]|nr:4-(cytidine 5'-diphospho)-2-C-methyl-D-erythritol kinase [Peptococcaceae bacterium]
MNTLNLRAPAKINWTLTITGRRPDGYHLLQTVFQSISLADDLRLTLSSSLDTAQIRCFCRSEGSCAGLRKTDIRAAALNGPSNLAYKAAQLLGQALEKKNIPCPDMTIHINKRIPLQAGLAGGSSDAAAVLRGFNRMLGNPLSRKELEGLACRCGSDTLFCLWGGTQWGEGTGNELTPLPSVAGWPLVVVKPEGGVSTRRAFEAYDKGIDLKTKPDGDCQEWRRVLAHGDKQSVARMMRNSLEQVSMVLCPAIEEAKEELIKAGCLTALMSGSGSAVFGLVRDKDHQEDVVYRMREKGFMAVWAVETSGSVRGQDNKNPYI